MPLCNKCRKFYPPGFVEKRVDNAMLCLFCEKNVDKIPIGDGQVVTREDIIKEYDIYLKQVRERNDDLKDIIRGKKDIPDNLLKT